MENERQYTASPAVQQAKQRYGIVGNAPALGEAVERAIKVAPIDLSVLVTGESGAGKEFFPQIIHGASARKHARYIAVNCGAIPEGTIDSELFGHEKGAFTGAVDSRKGYFEEADGGTIFLDEVAELPLTTQARLLRVLETGEYLRVGSSTVRKTNIRIVAATNVDLVRAVADGRFREDLYYRLSTIQIQVPPLRDRGSDIRLLARRFASAFAERYKMPPVSFSEEAELLMRRYRWPGNVRQLKNVVEQMALFEAGAEIDADTLKGYLPAVSTSYMPVAGESAHSYEREREMLFGMIFNMQSRIDQLQEKLDKQPAKPHENSHLLARAIREEAAENQYPTSLVISRKPDNDADTPQPCNDVPYAEVLDTPETMQDKERRAIRDALVRNSGHRKAAAAELQISERTLYRKIKEYGLE